MNSGVQPRILVASNAYPLPDDLYRYQFLHSRVLAYLSLGLSCEVFVVDNSAADDETRTYEFEGVAVLMGSPTAFGRHLENSGYTHLVVHVPMPYLLDAIDAHAPLAPTALWLHGFETEAWWRRWFVHLDVPRVSRTAMHRQRTAATRRLERLADFLGDHPDTTVVSVSDWFRVHCIEPDLGRALTRTATIPNFIDSDLFHPAERDASARRRVLVLRPFTSAKYAGADIIATIRAVAELDPTVEFTVCGDGPQFEAAIAPLADIATTTVHRGFVSRSEAAELHRNHGIFLNPTRWDSHGVSTGEAMASGLAVVSTDVAAVPEFVEHGVSGLLARPGDVDALSRAVVQLANDEDLRERIAEQGRRQVVEQCGFRATIEEEVELILGRGTVRASDPIDWQARHGELARELADLVCWLGSPDPEPGGS